MDAQWLLHDQISFNGSFNVSSYNCSFFILPEEIFVWPDSPVVDQLAGGHVKEVIVGVGRVQHQGLLGLDDLWYVTVSVVGQELDVILSQPHDVKQEPNG